LCGLGNAETDIERLAAVRQEGLAPQALDHLFAGGGQITDLADDGVHGEESGVSECIAAPA
jgi:hypothetical protein